MRVRVTEHIPNFCINGPEDLNRKESICDETEILQVPWLQQFKPMYFDRASLDSSYVPCGYVMTDYDPPKKWVVAIVRPA